MKYKWTQRKIGNWNKKVFGESNTGIIGHFKEEVEEFDDALDGPTEASEAADLVILLMARAHRKGYDLLRAVDFKMAVNVQRAWLPPDKQGIVRHKK